MKTVAIKYGARSGHFLFWTKRVCAARWIGYGLMVLSLKSLVKGSWQGKQFDYLASWTGVFLNWKSLKEREGW